MVLGLLPSIRGGLGELATTGQQTRLIDGYFKPYARVFEEVRYFSYLDETLERYTADPAVLARVRLYPGRRVHPWLYAFYMPILYRREFRECAVLRVFQVTGVIPDGSLRPSATQRGPLHENQLEVGRNRQARFDTLCGLH